MSIFTRPSVYNSISLQWWACVSFINGNPADQAVCPVSSHTFSGGAGGVGVGVGAGVGVGVGVGVGATSGAQAPTKGITAIIKLKQITPINIETFFLLN